MIFQTSMYPRRDLSSVGKCLVRGSCVWDVILIKAVSLGKSVQLFGDTVCAFGIEKMH